MKTSKMYHSACEEFPKKLNIMPDKLWIRLSWIFYIIVPEQHSVF